MNGRKEEKWKESEEGRMEGRKGGGGKEGILPEDPERCGAWLVFSS